MGHGCAGGGVHMCACETLPALSWNHGKEEKEHEALGVNYFVTWPVVAKVYLSS